MEVLGSRSQSRRNSSVVQPSGYGDEHHNAETDSDVEVLGSKSQSRRNSNSARQASAYGNERDNVDTDSDVEAGDKKHSPSDASLDAKASQSDDWAGYHDSTGASEPERSPNQAALTELESKRSPVQVALAKLEYAKAFLLGFQEDSSDKWNVLSGIASAYLQQVKRVGKLIVSEQSMPDNLKTIRPNKKFGGVAGGEKYVHQGILYKLTADAPIGDKFLYGGAQPSYAYAAKASSHAIRCGQLYHEALQHFFGSPSCTQDQKKRIHHLAVCQEVLLEYQGRRLSAQPLLDLDDEIVYGSGDGGRTVFADKDVHQALVYVAKTLHLAEHIVKDKKMACAGDIECKLLVSSKQGFMIDLARAMLPESPAACTHLPLDGHPVFFRMLRPELLQSLKTGTDSQGRRFPPLSPDAMTGLVRVTQTSCS